MFKHNPNVIVNKVKCGDLVECIREVEIIDGEKHTIGCRIKVNAQNMSYYNLFIGHHYKKVE